MDIGYEYRAISLPANYENGNQGPFWITVIQCYGGTMPNIKPKNSADYS